MNSLTVSDARKNFAEALRKAQSEPVVIEKHGEREAVLLSPQVFDRLMDAQDELDDIAAFDEAMAEEGENIPWETVKKELGWS
ncbi:MAG: type II toxin-antitoxin system Phd/YefM family antitoxin [Homoserinimonas sp.]|nr:type II toxin-antitoxin system Phd/YefM family antitoxin [Homoserinimonas sp.]MCW5944466.1 type II toxin-antitoxin system Phd/YefM family antitoxin [Cryobacterium sp.]